MIPMIRWELRRHRSATIWWSVGVAALISLTILAYGSVHNQADQLNKAFGSLSSSIGSFVGTTDMFSPTGYLNSQLYFVTLPILFIILSITLANGFLGKEETSRTLELLLARPISRSRLLAAKLIARALVMLIVGTVAAIITIICARAASIHLAAGNLLLANFGCVAFSGSFGMVAFALLATSLRTRRLAIVGAITFVLASYMLTSLAGLVKGLGGVAKLFPYHYYQPETLLGGHINSGFLIYTLALYVLGIGLAVVGFRRRDIA
jgi:ABC-2 type transport system permease protein